MAVTVSGPPTQTTMLSADPDFWGDAWEEVTTVDPTATFTLLIPGTGLVHGRKSFEEIAGHWRAQPPVYVRHIFPVQATATLTGADADVDQIVLHVASELAAYLAPDLPFSVQTRVLPGVSIRPFQVNEAVAALAAEISGAPLDVRAPVQVISIVCGAIAGDAPQAWMGLSSAADNLSNWAGGIHRFARDAEQVSRSEFKLLEALDVFDIEAPARGTALDLGAAPGGWTRILRQLEQYVTAVDPADLDPRIASDRNVRHLRTTAERYLADEPDQFDIILNDMRMDTRDSARLMVAYAKQLYPTGWGLVTLKLPGMNRRQALQHALAILEEGYAVAGVRQLFHNRSEVTVYLRPKRAR
jgi:23S rRNA (cytidine2498-2'-O)-methyltransferase